MKPADTMNGTPDPGEAFEIDGAPGGLDFALSRGRTPRISLKQWKMFHAVVDFDGFAGAANSLHVTQSTVSHAVAKLQEQLGVALFELKGRRAHVTEQGKVLLERSRDLIRQAIELEELAENLRHGWGPEIRVAVDPSFPSDLLTLALRKMSSAPHKIRLSVREATLDQAKQALHDNTVELAISSQLASGFVGKKLIEVEHVAVAHPDNPLFSLKREITFDDLKSQFQIAISDSNDYVASEASHRLPRYSRQWNVSTVDRAIGVMSHGLGYAWVPRYQVQHWLDVNHVRILPVVRGPGYRTSLYLISGRPLPADSAATKFAEALHACSERLFERR